MIHTKFIASYQVPIIISPISILLDDYDNHILGIRVTVLLKVYLKQQPKIERKKKTETLYTPKIIHSVQLTGYKIFCSRYFTLSLKSGAVWRYKNIE